MYIMYVYTSGWEISLQHLVSNYVTSAHHSTTSMHLSCRNLVLLNFGAQMSTGALLFPTLMYMYMYISFKYIPFSVVIHESKTKCPHKYANKNSNSLCTLSTIKVHMQYLAIPDFIKFTYYDGSYILIRR